MKRTLLIAVSMFFGCGMGSVDPGSDPAVGAASAALSEAPAAQPSYELEVVANDLGGNVGLARSINEGGTVAGYMRNANKMRKAFLYKGGELTYLPVPEGTNDHVARFVDQDGSACGYTFDTGQALLWRNGAVSVFPGSLPGAVKYLCARLTNGVVGVGFAYDAMNNARPVLFKDGKVVDIMLPGYESGGFYDANGAGLVGAFAGYADANNLLIHSLGYTYDIRADRFTKYPPLEGDTDTIVSLISEDGRLFGYSYNLETQNVVEFEPGGTGKGTILRTEPNGHGLIQGNGRDIVETYTGTAKGVLYHQGKWLDLESLVRNLDGISIYEINEMNQQGDMAGRGVRKNGEQVVIILWRR